MNKKVLIVEDSATQLNSLKIFFKRDGWETDTARDGIEAYARLHKDPPDVIVSDILMPRLSGFQLCRLLKSDPATSKIPVVLLTVLDKSIDKFWASQSGADRFVIKNGKFEQIIGVAKEATQEFPVDEEYKNNIRREDVNEEHIVTQINKILDDALMSATLTNEFRSIIDYASPDFVLAEKAFKILSAIVEYDVAGLFFEFPDKSAQKYIILDAQTVNITDEIAEMMSMRLLNGDGGKPRILSVQQDAPKIGNIEDFASYIELEFTYNKNTTGKVCFYSRRKTVWERLKFMQTLKSELDLFFKLKYLYDSTQVLSLIDDLTGLYTRRHLNETLSKEFERAKRYRTKASVAMADIDDFKKINDTYGHQAGDAVLKGAAKIFKDNLRKTDFIFRYGGEEILILMPETSLENAAIPLERIRKDIENFDFETGAQSIDATISIGAAAYGKNTASYPELIEMADKALYDAKKTGKNKVILAYE